MRFVTVGVGVVAVALVGIVGFAVLNLRALIGAHHDRLVARVEHAIGRPLVVGDVSPSWWPLGIRLRDVTIAEDPAFGTTPFLVADGVVMGVRAWPLLRGRIEVSGVTLDTPRVNIVRADDGHWNVASLGAPLATERGERDKARGRRFTFRVPVEWVLGVALTRVHDGTVTIVDHRRDALEPFVLRHVALRATDLRVGATAQVRVEASLFATDRPDVRLDLRVDALGERDLEHAPFTARVEVDDADLAVLSDRLGGRRVATGRLRRVTLDAEGTLERPRAALALDLADPGFRIGALPVGALRPIGLRLRATRAADVVTIEDLRATVGTLALHAEGEARLDRRRVALSVRSEPGGVAAFALDRDTFTLRAIEGRITFEPDGMSFAPLAVQVDDVPLSLRGGITGIDPPAVDVRVEGRPFGGTVAADLAVDAAGGARAHVEIAAIDLAAAAARLAPEVAGRVAGRGSGAAVLTGRLADGALVAGSLAGRGTLAVVDGSLRDVNLPDLVVEEVEALPFVPRLVTPATRERYGELFGTRDTIVESATVPFVIGRGRIAIEHAVLVNSAYQITGDGWLDEARALRFRGSVLLGASVSRTLREDVRAAKHLATDDGRIALPFVARGRLGAVRVEPDAKRLRERGLEALLGASIQPVPSPGTDAEPKERRRDDDIEERVLERLEKLLRP